MDSERKVRHGIQLLRLLKGEFTVSEAVDIIELVTKVPELVKRILEVAEREGLIRREDGKIIIVEQDAVEEKYDYPGIKKVECDDRCRRCGRQIKSCYYIILQDMEIGPLGGYCVRKMGIEED